MPISPADDHRFDRNSPAAEAKGLAFAKAVGAESLADLRKLSVESYRSRHGLRTSMSTGYLLRSDLTTIYRDRRQNDVPLLVGWTAEEGKDLIGFYLDASASTSAGRRDQMTKLLDYPPSDRLLAAYPGATDAEAAASIVQLTNDWWGWRMEYWAALQAKYGRSKSYVYYFAHRPCGTADALCLGLWRRPRC
jgi:para-nitrobenzyl esterase